MEKGIWSDTGDRLVHGRTVRWCGRLEQKVKVTVEWEKSHGITAMSKRTERRNCFEEQRLDSNDLMGPVLRQRRALDVKEICRVA